MNLGGVFIINVYVFLFMKLNLIDSLLVDISNLVPYVNESDDLLLLEMFINLLIKHKRKILYENENKIEGVI